MNSFGELLRRLRLAAKLSQGALGNHLGCSTPYISDVELGKRAPFGLEKLDALSRLFGVDLAELTIAAAESRGAFELSPSSELRREVGGLLMRRWLDLSDSQLVAIAVIARRRS